MSGNDQLMVLKANGDYDRFKVLLRNRLHESGWVDQVYALCQTSAQKNGNMSELYNEVAPKARAMVPDSVKKEILAKVKDHLLRRAGFYEDRSDQ